MSMDNVRSRSALLCNGGRRIIRLMAGVVVAMVVVVPAFANDWPSWRGPDGTRVLGDGALPLEWSADRNIAWTAELGGLGVSSPIVGDDRVIVTSQVGWAPLADRVHPTLVRGRDDSESPLDGGRRDRDGQVSFLVAAYDRATGELLWEHETAASGPLQPVHNRHNLASPSPVTDGRRVYAVFGTGQVVALELETGRVVWTRHLQADYGGFDIIWGHTSSPAVYDGLLYVLCDHPSRAYLLALDTESGQERWKVDRGNGRRSYSTPVVYDGPGGPELIINSNERIDAFQPQSGASLWYAGGPNQFPVPVPTYADGAIYTNRGHRSGPYMRIRLGGRGDVTDTHVDWRIPTGAPYVSSVLYYAGLVYMATDSGIVTCVDAVTGERVWRERIGGSYTASPVAADGKVYLFGETGETVVLAAGRDPLVLARNDLGVRTIASPAVSDGRIYVRTDSQLIAIGE